MTQGGSTFVTTGPVTVAQAVSGSVTSISTLGAEATGNGANTSPAPTGNAAAAGSDTTNVKVMGALLGGLVAVVGLL